MKKRIQASIEFDLPHWMKEDHAARVARRFEAEFKKYMERLLEEQSAFTRQSHAFIRNADYVVNCEGFSAPALAHEMPPPVTAKASQGNRAHRR